MNTMSTFPARLRKAMSDVDLTQKELCIKSGIPPSSLSQLLAGKNGPGKNRLRQLSTALGVSVAYLDGTDLPDIPPPPLPSKSIGTATAARCIGKCEQFVRVGLQRGILPFGYAVPTSAKRWNYYINPHKLRDFVGGERFDSFFRLGECKEAAL